MARSRDARKSDDRSAILMPGKVSFEIDESNECYPVWLVRYDDDGEPCASIGLTEAELDEVFSEAGHAKQRLIRSKESE